MSGETSATETNGDDPGLMPSFDGSGEMVPIRSADHSRREPVLRSDSEELARWRRRNAAAVRTFSAMTSPRSRFQRLLSLDSTVPKAAMDVGVALAWYLPGDGSSMTGARPSRWSLSQDAKVSTRNVDRGLMWLKDNGWIQVVVPGKNGSAPTEWRLHVPEALTCEAPADLVERVASSDTSRQVDDSKHWTPPPSPQKDLDQWRAEGLPEDA